MKHSSQMALTAAVCAFCGCASVPQSVDGLPITPAERQVAKESKNNREGFEAYLGLCTYGAAPLFVELLHVCGKDVGHRNHKPIEDAVRKVRQTKQESDALSEQLIAAKEYNRKLTSHCTELLGEVDALSGKRHATLDQKKDLLGQIKSQMSRMDFAGEQTDQALTKNQEVLASIKSSGAGHDKELRDLQGQIASLQSKRKQINEKNAKLARMHKEISSQ